LILIFLIIPSLSRTFSQEIQLPFEAKQDYVFAEDKIGRPTFITKKGLYTYNSKWSFKSIKIDSLNNTNSALDKIGKFDNQTFFISINNKKIYLSLVGGGHVFTIEDGFLTKIDNSVIQRNQYNASFFTHKNKIFMYGGYGFWNFKNYITYLDEQTGQWEIIVPKSSYIPQGRWKSIAHKVNDKLFVLGGRNNSKKTSTKDTKLNDHFVFDLETDQFTDLGEINPLIPRDFSVNSNLKIENKQAYLDESRIILFDFLKDTAQIFYKKDIFKGIDTKKPVVVKNDTIYFVKSLKKKTFLSAFPLQNLNYVKPKTLQISKKKDSKLLGFLSAFLIIVVCWVGYKLFVFKDFLKGLLLYDESKIYYENNSAILSLQQLKTIKSLEKSGQISSENLNKIISEKKFVKSHFTALRIKLINEINTIYKAVTNNNAELIEEVPDPRDKRYKIYKITKQVSQKESFLNFLFRL